MSLIEVLIALGMVGILSAVIATVLQSMQRAQNQTNLINTIEGMRLNIQKLIADGNAWRQTVEDPVNSGASGTALFCVQDNSACTHSNVPTAYNKIDNPGLTNAVVDALTEFVPLTKLNYSSSETPPVYDPYINTTTADSGFTDKGTPCTGWVATGNPLCPIRWVIKMAFECQAAATCLNPTVRVIAILYYRPGPDHDLRSVINEGKYRIDLRRGAKGDARAERFYTHYTQPACGVGCVPADTENGGACDPGPAGTTIPFVAPPATDNENTNVISVVGGVMTFVPGTYTCTAISSCFACGRVRLALNVNGVDQHTSLTLLSKRWDQTQVTINNATFTINANTPVFVKQMCDTVPGGDPLLGLSNINLGMALPDYTSPTKFAEIQCTRIF